MERSQTMIVHHLTTFYHMATLLLWQIYDIVACINIISCRSNGHILKFNLQICNNIGQMVNKQLDGCTRRAL